MGVILLALEAAGSYAVYESQKGSEIKSKG